jgi:Plexin repeat
MHWTYYIIFGLCFLFFLIFLQLLLTYKRVYPGYYRTLEMFASSQSDHQTTLVDQQYIQQEILKGNMKGYDAYSTCVSNQNEEKLLKLQNQLLENIDGLDFPDQDPENRAAMSLTCPSQIQKEHTFCHLDTNDILERPNYQCVFQKSNVFYPASPACCNFQCTKENLKRKIQQQKKNWTPAQDLSTYACLDDTNQTCSEYTRDRFRPEKNTCGVNMISQAPRPIYKTMEDCKRAIRCESIASKKQCLNTAYCGWCTDENGNGKCVDGTPEGPMNGTKYYYCRPEKRTPEQSFTYSNANTYVLQGDVSPAIS